jgi:hypothetical protein
MPPPSATLILPPATLPSRHVNRRDVDCQSRSSPSKFRLFNLGSCKLAENPTLRAVRFGIADARLPHSSSDDDLHENMVTSAVSKVTDGLQGLFQKDTQHDNPDWPF